ncbi:MAG: hypothetical protein J6S67_05445 [Methanobrevibacter sp.]|nr:hypothetical protein [Methanobrevibacter sp.]
MTKEMIEGMLNSELLAHYVNSRDNLISITRRMNENRHTEGLLELFDIEREQYDQLQTEIFKRMERGRR